MPVITGQISREPLVSCFGQATVASALERGVSEQRYYGRASPNHTTRRGPDLRVTLQLLPAPKAGLVAAVTVKQFVSSIAGKTNCYLLPCHASQRQGRQLGIIGERLAI